MSPEVCSFLRAIFFVVPRLYTYTQYSAPSRSVAWAITLAGSTHAAYRALHALCRWPMLVLLFVLPLPL